MKSSASEQGLTEQPPYEIIQLVESASQQLATVKGFLINIKYTTSFPKTPRPHFIKKQILIHKVSMI